MSTPASFKNHPIHPILVVFPLGLWVFSLVCDVIFMFGGSPIWKDVALYTLGGGIIGALLAAVPGFIDYISMKDSETKKIGTKHMILNLIAVVVFAGSFFLRLGGDTQSLLPVLVSLLGVVLISISGFLGGEMVYVHGVGVQTPESVAKKRSVDAA
jgi:uncharacterized membrane protein